MNTNHESVAYRSFSPSEFEARGARKVTTGRQVSFTLLMNVTAIVIELSTRGTVHSDNWFLRLSDQAMPRSYHPLDYG